MSEQKRKARLSQCMIVKDEEDNIRRALSWGQAIMWEQIVVDTGSTDRTVEIAQEMGAKVFHFAWCDDFSAAKNYAIEQASGEWIVFLDADEYMLEADAERLGKILCDIESNETVAEAPHVIRCAWQQIGEDGSPFSVSVQDRIFRNIPEIRYHGRIHEQISLPDGEAMICQDEQKRLSICHTGYVPAVMKEKKKWERNIRLLKKEIEENPGNGTAWSYLGDAYNGLGELQKAAESYEKALAGSYESSVSRWGRMNAGKSLLKKYAHNPALAGSDRRVEEIAEKVGYPATDNPDIYFFISFYYMNRKDYKRAYHDMKRAIELLDVYRGDDVIYLRGNLEKAYIWMAGLCQQLKESAEELYYGFLALRQNKYLENILCELLFLLKKDDAGGARANEAWTLLLDIYDRENPRDITFLFKGIKTVGYPLPTQEILNSFSTALHDGC